MRLNLWFVVLILLVVITLLPATESPWDNPVPSQSSDSTFENDLWQGLQKFCTALRDLFYLFAESIVKLLGGIWAWTPHRFRFLIGVVLFAILILSFWGLTSISVTRRLSKRMMG